MTYMATANRNKVMMNPPRIWIQAQTMIQINKNKRKLSCSKHRSNATNRDQNQHHQGHRSEEFGDVTNAEERRNNFRPVHFVTGSAAKHIDDIRIAAIGGYVSNVRAIVEGHRRYPRAKEKAKRVVKEADPQPVRPAAELHQGVTHR